MAATLRDASVVTPRGLPTRQSEWDAAVSLMAIENSDFRSTCESMCGCSLNEAFVVSVDQSAAMVADNRRLTYRAVAQAITGSEHQPEILAIRDGLGEERLVAAVQVGTGNFSDVFRAARPDGFGRGGDDLIIKVAKPKESVHDRKPDHACRGASPTLRTVAGRMGEDPRESVILDPVDGNVGEALGKRGWHPHDIARLVVRVEQGIDDYTIGGRHIVDRDVKPENIGMSVKTRADGTTYVDFAKLDYGLAVLVGEPTTPNAGTPAYAAPEQIDVIGGLTGKVPADRKWDSFSIAATAYEAATGKSFRDPIMLFDGAGHPSEDLGLMQLAHESGFREVRHLPDWELILHSGYHADPAVRATPALLAARAQAHLDPRDRALLEPKDLSRYANAFLDGFEPEKQAVFARVDAMAIGALIADPRLDDPTRSALRTRRSELCRITLRQEDQYLGQCERHDQHQRVQALAKVQAIAALDHKTARVVPTQNTTAKTLQEWQSSHPTRGPPSRGGPTR